MPPITEPSPTASDRVDANGLVFFRITFGILLAIHFFRQAILITSDPNPILLPYLGWEWLPRPNAESLTQLASALSVSGLLIALGLFFRVSVLIFLIGFGYWFLVDEPLYQNHYYLMLLVGGILLFSEAGRAYAVDNWIFSRPSRITVSAMNYWVLRIQMAVVYLFGGVAKLNPDWLRGEPLREWLSGLYTFHLDLSAWAMLMSYGAIAFDLLVAPALLWRRTRGYAIATAILFHLTNFWLFRIGIFPFLAIGLTLLFLPPSWPSRLTSRPELSWSAHPVLIIFVAVQILVPLRHWLYPGSVAWTMEGQKFSWMMKLHTRTGQGKFLIKADREFTEIDPYDRLPPFIAGQVLAFPQNMVKYARILRAEFESRGGRVESVTAKISLRLNDHPPRPYVDPDVDLSRVSYGGWTHAEWSLSGPW